MPPRPPDQETPSPVAQGKATLPVGPLAVAVFMVVLLALSYLVLRDFLVPLAWSAILVYISWPLHLRLQRWLGGRANLGALLMTLLLSTAIVIPVLGLTAMLGDELADGYRSVRSYMTAEPFALPTAITEIPWLGERLHRLAERIASDPSTLRTWVSDQGPQWLEEARSVLAGIGRNLFKFGVSLLGLFFLYRDGEHLIGQLRTVLRRFLGHRSDGYWSAVAVTTQGVVYGLVLTALAQGALAGIGYAVAGIGPAGLLGIITALLALVPFGAPVVWGTTGLWLLASGEVWAGIGLLLWGGLVVSFVDNIIRPLAISSTARIPFFLVLLGVLGGLRAFGLIGLFLGPMVLTVMLAVWREWLEEQGRPAGENAPVGPGP